MQRSPLLLFEFDNSSNLIWNVLVTSGNAQCILAGSKPQKSFFLSFDFGYLKLWLNWNYK